MKKSKKICQSCGMPLDRDPQKCGTNADSSRSDKYCIHCYQNGVLAGEGMNVKEFQEFCRQKMVENGFPKFTAWLFTRGYKRLKRWKS